MDEPYKDRRKGRLILRIGRMAAWSISPTRWWGRAYGIRLVPQSRPWYLTPRSRSSFVDAMDTCRTLAALAADPEALDEVPSDDLPGILGSLETLKARVWQMVNGPPRPVPEAEHTPVAGLGGLVTADQVADWLGLGKQRVYELTRRGDLPHVQIGRQYRYDPAAIEEFLAAGGTAGED